MNDVLLLGEGVEVPPVSNAAAIWDAKFGLSVLVSPSPVFSIIFAVAVRLNLFAILTNDAESVKPDAGFLYRRLVPLPYSCSLAPTLRT